MKEYNIGERIALECIERPGCQDCFFYCAEGCDFLCRKEERQDGKDVQYIQIDGKVITDHDIDYIKKVNFDAGYEAAAAELGWRKYPEAKPESCGLYLVAWVGNSEDEIFTDVCLYESMLGKFNIEPLKEVKAWMTIPKLGGGEK